jgi:hypothetical protein
VSPRPNVWLLTRKKASSVKEACSKRTPQQCLADNIEQDPDDPEQVDEGDIRMEYCSDCNKKITCKKLGQYRYRLIIRNIGEVWHPSNLM